MSTNFYEIMLQVGYLTSKNVLFRCLSGSRSGPGIFQRNFYHWGIRAIV